MCIVSAKSITGAQMVKKALASKGIFSSVVAIDPELTKHGCSFGVSLKCDKNRVREILRDAKIEYGEIFDGRV